MQIQQVLPIISQLSPDQRVQLVMNLGMPAEAVAELENMCESVGMPLNGGRATERGGRDQRGGLGGNDDEYEGAGALEDGNAAAAAMEADEKPSIATVRSFGGGATLHAKSRAVLTSRTIKHTLTILPTGSVDDEA